MTHGPIWQRTRRRALAALAVSPLLLVAPGALARKKAGTSFKETVTIGGKTLKLNGLGVREATVFKVDVYVAGLYVEKPSKVAKELLDDEGPKYLLLKMVRDVDKDDLVGAWNDGLKKNGGGAAIKAGVKRLNKMMADVKKGETLSMTFDPVAGVTVKFAGKKKGTIAGKGFSRWLLAIWLGKNPPNPGLKRGLLKG